jgi:hypothetical protein
LAYRSEKQSKRVIKGPAVLGTPQLVSDSTRAVLQQLEAYSSSGGGRWLFPNGIDVLELSLTFGTSDAVAKIELKLAGPRTAGDAVAQNTSSSIQLRQEVAEPVLEYCRTLKGDDVLLGDCNKFVKNVAAHFGISIPAGHNADRITDMIQKPPWIPIVRNDPTEAMTKAAAGNLVIAGMTVLEYQKYKPEAVHGHVAVVHGKPVLGHPMFPLASWGVYKGRGQIEGSIRDSFDKDACDDRAVHFSFMELRSPR